MQSKNKAFGERSACLLTLDPLVDQLRIKGIKSGVKAAQELVDRYKDFGAGWFHQETKQDFQAVPPGDRMAMAMYLTGTSVKLQWLVGYLYQLVYVQCKKAVVFVNWPLALSQTVMAPG